MVVVGRRADGADGLRKMLGAAVLEIIAIHRGHHDVGKPELGFACATCAGSPESSAPGLPVVTLQKRRLACRSRP